MVSQGVCVCVCTPMSLCVLCLGFKMRVKWGAHIKNNRARWCHERRTTLIKMSLFCSMLSFLDVFLYVSLFARLRDNVATWHFVCNIFPADGAYYCRYLWHLQYFPRMRWASFILCFTRWYVYNGYKIRCITPFIFTLPSLEHKIFAVWKIIIGVENLANVM